VLVSTGVMSNISPQKNARTPEQNISLRNLCKNFWLDDERITKFIEISIPYLGLYNAQNFAQIL
jgi:hypothetical protein